MTFTLIMINPMIEKIWRLQGTQCIYRMHNKEDALKHPYSDMNMEEFTRICELFANEEFQLKKINSTIVCLLVT